MGVRYFSFTFLVGYGYYNIVRDAPDKVDGNFDYYLSAADGAPCKGMIVGAIRDPLRSIGNCFMKINSARQITGIIVDQDWVEMK